MSMLAKTTMPVKFKKLYKEYSKRAFNLLDVGCGNHSASITKKWFPTCKYYGIDKENYYNDENDFALMEEFYDIDLSDCMNKLNIVPNEFFDVVMITHVIEHLPNGLDVLSGVAPKLRTGGKIYIEFPAIRSLELPSTYGTLNFCDDETHVRVYEVSEVVNLLLSENFKIIRAGTRRDIARIVFTPLTVVYDLFRHGRVRAGHVWDITGFASYVYAEKRLNAA